MQKDDRTELGFTVKELTEKYEVPKGKEYRDSKWGKYLRAPAVYWKILERAGDKLCKLSDVAEVHAGIITGNNARYYMPIQKEFDEQNYSPVFKTPRDYNKILLKRDDAKNLIKTRHVPFSIRKANILWVDLRGAKHLCHYNQDLLPFEHNFYGINAKNKKDNFPLCVSLNSTPSWLFIEIQGRVNLGGGALRLVADGVKCIPIIRPNVINVNTTGISNFVKRRIENAREEMSKTDRRELDLLILEALGFTNKREREQVLDELYEAIIKLIRQRLEKAKTIMGEEEE